MSNTARKLTAAEMSGPATYPHLKVIRPEDAGAASQSPAPQASAVEMPSSELLAELKAASLGLESATPQEIIAWAVEHHQPNLGMATAFGPEGCVIIHMLSQIDPTVNVFNLDTGYQFKETLDMRQRVLDRYGIDVELKQPQLSVDEYETLNGGPVYSKEPDRCCFDRKLSVLRAAAGEFSGWMSAIRRDQSPDRAKAPIVGWDKKFGLVKISPLANWTKQQVWDLIVKEDVPYNPLHDQGYPSVGCQPCTRAVLFGEDERAGRWSGSAKTECGLHSLDDDSQNG
jgi:phosphoadenosine phosphosulfate reductase